MMKQRNLLLIDCNAMLNVYYYGSLPAELKKDDDPKYYAMIHHNKYGVYNNAIIPFMNMMQEAITSLDITHMACAFDMGSKTLRKQKSQDYKANRKGCPFPLKEQVDILKNSLRTMGVSSYISDLYEADDIIGTIASKSTDMDHIYVITTDHDYFQLANDKITICGYTKGKEFEDLSQKYPDRIMFGKFFKYDAEMIKKTMGITPDQIADYKGFAGDHSDNIPGVSSVGKSYAVKILNLYKHGEDMFSSLQNDRENTIKNLKQAGVKTSVLSEEQARTEFTQSKELATIIRDVPVGELGDALKLRVKKEALTDFKKFIK